MSEHLTSQAVHAGTKGLQVEPPLTHRPPVQMHRDDDNPLGVVTHLSADQIRTAQTLHRLFQSLCGGQPGQYWPQALLDSAGRFSRPGFPGTDHGGRQ